MLILSTRLQVKHTYYLRDVSSLYRFPYVHNKCPNNGPADYWSFTLTEMNASEELLGFSSETRISWCFIAVCKRKNKIIKNRFRSSMVP